MKTEIEQIISSPYKNDIVLVPYNEPDGKWFSGLETDSATLAAFDAEWLETYQFIKGLWPQARIAGPNLYQYEPTAFQTFFMFCKQNRCLPDVVTWHELVNPSTIAPAVAAYRALESSIGFSRPVSLDEYAAQYHMTSPARMVSWLSAIEARRSVVTCRTGTSSRPVRSDRRLQCAGPVRCRGRRHRSRPERHLLGLLR